MEARMDDEIMSMMRALLEAQERRLASDFTNHHDLHSSSVYQGELYAQENQSGYNAGYQSWEPPSNHGFEGSSVYQGGLYAEETQSGYNAGYNAWEPTSHHGVDHSSDYQGGLYAQENNSGYGEGYHACAPNYQGGNLGGTYAPGHPNGYDESQHAWAATNHHGFDSYNAYQGAPWDEQQTQANHIAYDEGYNSWDMHNDHGGTYSSPVSTQEDHYNMLKLLLEAQTKTNEMINSFAFGIHSNTPSAAATEHVESFNNNLSTWKEESDSDCISIQETRPTEIPPIDMDAGFADSAPLGEDYLQELGWSVLTFEDILGFTVEKPMLSYDDLLLSYETLVRSYEEQFDHEEPLSYSPIQHVELDDPCQGGLVVDCKKDAYESSTVMNDISTKDVIHVQTIPKMQKMASQIADTSKEEHEVGSPMKQPFDQHLGKLHTNGESIAHPLKLPFQQVRMKEFGGWFYDEYDPGDPRFRRVHLDKSFSQA